MSIVSFVIFAVVALLTVLFSLFIALIISRRKNSNFEASHANQLLSYTIEDNQNQNFNSNVRISEYDEYENFVSDRDERPASEVINQNSESDPYYSLSKRNFTIAGSRLIPAKPSRIVEPVQNRQIRLQFK